MRVQNPYEPPEGLGDLGELPPDPESFRIEEGMLVVLDGAVLPEACLKTGEETDLTRHQESFHWRSRWCFVLPLFMSAAVSHFANPWYVPWVLLAWLPFMMIVKEKVSVQYSLGRSVLWRLRVTILSGIACLGAGLFGLILDFEGMLQAQSFLPGLLLIGGVLLVRLSRFPRMARIGKGEGTFSKIHPRALEYLEAWKRASSLDFKDRE